MIQYNGYLINYNLYLFETIDPLLTINRITLDATIKYNWKIACKFIRLPYRECIRLFII